MRMNPLRVWDPSFPSILLYEVTDLSICDVEEAVFRLQPILLNVAFQVALEPVEDLKPLREHGNITDLTFPASTLPFPGLPVNREDHRLRVEVNVHNSDSVFPTDLTNSQPMSQEA